MKFSAIKGFTLVEMLVVISIMALIGVVALANYQSFGEDQKLKNDSLNIQSQLRTAQTNATTNLKCNTQSSATWQVEFQNSTTLNLKCQEPSAGSILKKTLTLSTNVTIQSWVPTGADCPPGFSFIISFAPLTGSTNLVDDKCTALKFTLLNSRTASTKYLTIEKGGRIYVE